MTTTAVPEPADQTYRSGPVEWSIGAAENARYRPSGEYATSPTTVTPLAISTWPTGVSTGVGSGLPGSGVADCCGLGPGVAVGGGVSSVPFAGTGTTKILPFSVPPVASNTSW